MASREPQLRQRDLVSSELPLSPPIILASDGNPANRCLLKLTFLGASRYSRAANSVGTLFRLRGGSIDAGTSTITLAERFDVRPPQKVASPSGLLMSHDAASFATSRVYT